MVQSFYMKYAHALVIGNWKLNPTTNSEAKNLFTAVRKAIPKDSTAIVVVAPPYIFIPELAKAKSKNTILGAQDVAFEERGALTGEVGPAMLASFGVEYVIVGHSERRAMGETDAQVNKKIVASLKRKLVPVVCIGEKRRDSQGQFFDDIAAQIKALSEGLTPLQLSKIVIAYEPIWAIGTGATATAEDVKEMQLFIVSTLTKLFDRKVAEKIRLIYGGSVKDSNARDLYENGGMSGFLVGGASLEAASFAAIIKATKK